MIFGYLDIITSH